VYVKKLLNDALHRAEESPMPDPSTLLADFKARSCGILLDSDGSTPKAFGGNGDSGSGQRIGLFNRSAKIER